MLAAGSTFGLGEFVEEGRNEHAAEPRVLRADIKTLEPAQPDRISLSHETLSLRALTLPVNRINQAADQ